MTILDDRDVTPEERAAIADEPRPGVWVERHEVIRKVVGKPVVSRLTGDPYPVAESLPEWRGDGRALDQLQTDRLIAVELTRLSEDSVQRALEIESIVGYEITNEMITMRDVAAFAHLGETCLAYSQRGGIHSDPLVRLLAFRAWGDRDRGWRKRDTARALDTAKLAANPVGWPSRWDAYSVAYGFDGVVLHDEDECEVVEAQRGGRVARVELTHAKTSKADDDVWLDVADELDAKLTRGGEPLPSGPLTFDITAR